MFWPSCGNESYQSKYEDYQEKLESIKAAQSADYDSTTSKTTEKTQTTASKTEEEKDNIKNYEILYLGEFYKGIAAAQVSITERQGYSSLWWDVDYEYWTFIDCEGNLLMEPRYYKVQQMSEIAWVQVGTYSDRYDAIVDETGKELVSTLEEGVVSVSHVSRGLYWVVTVDETLSGNVYTTTYYNTKGEKQFSLENMVPGGYGISYYDVDDGCFNRSGYALVTTADNVKASKIIDTKGNIVYEVTDKRGNPTRLSSIDKSFNELGQELGLWALVDSSEIGFDPETHSEFKSAESIEWEVSESYNNQPRLVTLYLRSSDNVNFWAIADENGNIKMKPQKNISLSYTNGSYVGETYTFSEGLCIAKDVSTGLYGYINENGEWVIKPQYREAESFSEGYATVVDSNENCKVINKKGEVVIQGKS